jgi:hypothetical protein
MPIVSFMHYEKWERFDKGQLAMGNGQWAMSDKAIQ